MSLNPLSNLLASLGQGVHSVAASARPPQWLVQEIQNRIVLTANHLLQQEPEAMERLQRHSGKTVLLRADPWSLPLQATPAGLLQLAQAETAPDLTLHITDSVPSLLSKGISGEKPNTQITGDVQLAAEINWLIDHVRWDVEEDMSKWIGDAAAHRVGIVLRQAAGALRQFAAALTRQPPSA